MRWLLHGPMTKAVGEAVVRHGHQVRDLVHVKLPPEATAGEVLKVARAEQLEVMTTDAHLVAAVFEGQIPFSRTMVFLQLAGGEVEQDDAVDRLFARYKRLSPQRLYTLTETRVKVRQLPGG